MENKKVQTDYVQVVITKIILAIFSVAKSRPDARGYNRKLAAISFPCG